MAAGVGPAAACDMVSHTLVDLAARLMQLTPTPQHTQLTISPALAAFTQLRVKLVHRCSFTQCAAGGAVLTHRTA